MEPSLLDKLVTEVRRYQNKDFLKAAMAVCALAANADDEVDLAERYSIDRALETEPALRLFDFEQLGVFHQITPLNRQGASIQQRVDFDVVGSELRLCISGEAVLAQGGDQLHGRTEAGQVPGDDAGASEISVLLQLLQ